MVDTKIKLNKGNSIGGFLKIEIRKAYFQKKLPEFLSEFQAKCEDLDEIERLKKYLEKLKLKETGLIEDFSKILGEEILKTEKTELPLAKFLGEMSEEEKKSFKQWKKGCETAISTIRRIIESIRLSLSTKVKLEKDDWLDNALEVATLMNWVDQDRVYKDQIYRKLLMRTKKIYSCSRLEAEEMTKTTQEYRDYKLAILFKENIKEFIMLAKKKGAEQW